MAIGDTVSIITSAGIKTGVIVRKEGHYYIVKVTMLYDKFYKVTKKYILKGENND